MTRKYLPVMMEITFIIEMYLKITFDVKTFHYCCLTLEKLTQSR